MDKVKMIASFLLLPLAGVAWYVTLTGDVSLFLTVKRGDSFEFSDNGLPPLMPDKPGLNYDDALRRTRLNLPIS